MLAEMRGSAVIERKQRRGWMRIAVLAIGCAVLLLLAFTLVPGGSSGHAADFVAILPLLLVGILSPLSLLGLSGSTYVGRLPQAPALVPSFQRPPPFCRG
jgi:hypothetical protein